MSRKESTAMKVRGPKGKKFLTPTEELCDWMISLGYKIPKHVRPEHFEYIFQNEDTARLVRQMMKEIKSGNIIHPEEKVKFEKMKKEETILYGSELEAAFSRVKSIEIEKARKEQANIEKEEDLDRLIAQKKEEIAKFKAIDHMLSETIEAAQKNEENGKAYDEYDKQESEKLDREIVTRQEELAALGEALQEKLKSVHLNLSTEADTKRAFRVCDKDWMKFLEEEENLHFSVKAMFDKFNQAFTGSVSGSRDLEFEEEIDPFFSETVYRQFKQQEEHLERLRQLVVMEKTRELELDIEMAGAQEVLEDMPGIVEKARMWYRADSLTRERYVRQAQQNCEKYDVIMRNEKQTLFESVQEDILSKLTAQVRGIADCQTRTKKRNQEFMTFLVNILINQRVRVDVIRELIRAEKIKNEKFAWELQEYRGSMFELHKKEELIQHALTGSASVDPELEEALRRYRIPSMAYLDPRCQYETMRLIKAHEGQEKTSDQDKLLQTLESSCKENSQHVENLCLLFKNLRVKTATATPLDEAVANVESVHKEMEGKLLCHDKNKDQVAKNAVDKKQDSLNDMAATVSEFMKIFCKDPTAP